jgi:hypothetical protein
MSVVSIACLDSVLVARRWRQSRSHSGSVDLECASVCLVYLALRNVFLCGFVSVILYAYTVFDFHGLVLVSSYGVLCVTSLLSRDIAAT